VGVGAGVGDDAGAEAGVVVGVGAGVLVRTDVGAGVDVCTGVDAGGSVVAGVELHPPNMRGTRKSKVTRKSSDLCIIRPPSLLPFYGRRGLGGNIVDNAVDAVYLVNDAVGDTRQQVVGQTRPVGGHGVIAGDGAHRY
jgi:hypothetical protein